MKKYFTSINKKVLMFAVLLFAFVFSSSTTAFAALTLGSTSISSNGALTLTGSANSIWDLGVSHTLSLQTTNNGPITTGTGLFTLGGSLVASIIRPLSDSTTAIQINKADGITNVLDVDTTNGTVGVGTTTSTGTAMLNVVANNTIGLPIEIHSNFANGIDVYAHATQAFRGPSINMNKSRGTQTSPVAVSSADNLGYLSFGGYDGSVYGTGGQIAPIASETWTTTNHGADIIFSNVNQGSVNLQEAMRISNNHFVGIGTNAPRANLDVQGHISSRQSVPPTPSVTGTGYSGASITAGSTDNKGAITATVGTVAGTLVVTFQTAYTTTPICTATPANPAAQVDVTKMYVTTSTTALTLNFVATPTGGSETWNYICLQ